MAKPSIDSRYTDLVTDRSKTEQGDYLGTVGGIRVRFVNCKAKNPNSTRQSPPFHNNWNAYRVDTGEEIAEAWSSRVGAAHYIATVAYYGRLAA